MDETDQLPSEGLLEAINGAAIVTDPDGVVLGWNGGAEALYGWTRAEAIGQRVLDLVMPGEETAHAHGIMRDVTSGESWEGDFFVRHRDGHVFIAHVHDAPIRSADGTILGILGISRDVSEERGREQAAADQKRLENVAADAAPAVIAVARVEKDGFSVIYRNEPWIEYTGQAGPSPAPAGATPPVHPDDLDEEALRRVRERVRSGEVVDLEARFRNGSGEYRRFRFRVSPIPDSQGLPGLVTVVGVDIEQRRRAAELARQREDVLRSLADAIPALLIVSVPEPVRGARPIFYNRRWTEYTGLAEADLVSGKARDALYHPDDLASMPAYRQRAASPRPFEGYFRFRRHDGEYRWHHIVHQPIFGDDKATPEILVTMGIDVHDAREAEASANRLAAIVDSSDAAIIGKTLDGVITSWNRGAETLYGYTAEEAVGMSIKVLVPPDRREQLRDIYARLQRGEQVPAMETERVAKDGRRIPVSLTVSPVRDGQGRIMGASAVARDRSREERLVTSLRRANAIKEEFLGLVSHELRTPLSTVVGLSAVLHRRGERYDAETREIFADLHAESARLQTIIENMLVLTRGDGEEMEMEPVALPGLIRGAVQRFGNRAAGVEVLVDEEPGLPLASGQPGWIEQIVENLLSNAHKYGPPQGPIRVHIEAADDDEATVVVRVIDAGPGIEEDEAALMFEPFYRGRASAGKPGVGLGLAVCQRLAELQGARLSAQRADPCGTEMTLYLRRWGEHVEAD